MPRDLPRPPYAPKGHVISMTLDHSVTPSLSVATCTAKGCSWVNKVEWRRENHALQDAAIDAHWRAVEAENDGTPDDA